MLSTLAVENYRSLRRLVVPLERLTVVTGANGSGKTTLYRALRLLAECARNGAVAALAREGGLPSTLWAGPGMAKGSSGRGPVGLRLGFAGGSDDYGYAVDLGLPIPSLTAFGLDPEIKREVIWRGPILRSATPLCDRHNTVVRLRHADGSWLDAGAVLRPYDSMLAEVADPTRAPELLIVREQMRSWRFYDSVRTDLGAPARATQIGTRTTVLAHDGEDLAAALQTIREIGAGADLDRAVDRAFPGARVEVGAEHGLFALTFHQPGLLRPLTAAELSDGTLRFLLWVAALLSPRPPELLVLNEPETSLHPDLLSALATLVATASEASQVLVVTHSAELAKALRAAASTIGEVELVKEAGHTTVRGQGPLDAPAWAWPKR